VAQLNHSFLESEEQMGKLLTRADTQETHLRRRPLRLTIERGKNEVERENDREPDPPHGHLV
jgi:hypothetical protein